MPRSKAMQEALQPGAHPRRIRMGIRASHAEGGAPLAVLHLRQSEAGAWTLALQAIQEDAPSYVPLCDALRALGASGPEADGGPDSTKPAVGEPDEHALGVWQGVRRLLESKGFSCEDLPEEDFALTMEVDGDSGRRVAGYRWTHDFRRAGGDVPESLLERLGRVFDTALERLVALVGAAVDAGDHARAAEAVAAAHDRGELRFATTDALLPALLRIDVEHVPADHRIVVRVVRVSEASRLHRPGLVETDIHRLLEEWQTAPPDARRALRLDLASAAAEKGAVESALAAWRGELADPALPPDARGVIHARIARVLGYTADTWHHLRLAADAFLQQGNRKRAAGSLIRAARCLLGEQPAKSIELIDEAVALFGAEGLLERDARADLLRIRAEALLDLGRAEEALAAVEEACKLRVGIAGAEQERAGTLCLAATCARRLGRADLADHYTLSADELALQTGDDAIPFARRVEQLMTAFDPIAADELRATAQRRARPRDVAYVEMAIACSDPTLGPDVRLQRLECTFLQLKATANNERDLEPLRLAIALQLTERGERERALVWYREILRHEPLHAVANQNLAATLWKLGRWDEAAEFFEGHIHRLGESPRALYGLGRSLLEAGAANRAAPLLHRALQLLPPGHPRAVVIAGFRDRALSEATELPGLPPAPSTGPAVRLDELRASLVRFREHIQAERRMTFHRPTSGAHDWISNPEQHAKNLLWTFLAASFGPRLRIFEEVGAGAGRIDLYVTMDGGVSFVIELKMCGGRYSSGYAFEGEEQVLHYMENKSTRVGFLVVFDARVHDFGVGLRAIEPHGSSTVYVEFVDVRPAVKQGGRRRPSVRAKQS